MALLARWAFPFDDSLMYVCMLYNMLSAIIETRTRKKYNNNISVPPVIKLVKPQVHGIENIDNRGNDVVLECFDFEEF